MSYIGREPQIGNFQMCDAISVVNNQAAYTMQVGGVAVIPGGNFNVIASVNGSIQKAGTSFTISSSTITFSQNLVTGDVIDFILILGSVLDLGVPSDGTVTTGKIADNAVTNAKLANSAITLNGSAVSLGGSATIGGGKIGQLVTMTHSTSVTTTSGSFQDSGATLNITPSATSSKVFVIAQVNCGVTRSNAESYMSLGIMRASTQIFTQAQQGFGGYIGNSNAYQNFGIQTLAYVDSPSSTSQLTYKINFKASAGNAIVQYGSTPTILTLMEVLA